MIKVFPALFSSLLLFSANASATILADFGVGPSVTTPSAGFNNVTAILPALSTENYWKFFDPLTGRIGGGEVSGTLHYYWDASVNEDFNGTADFAAIQLYRGGGEVFGVGNNWGAWAYSTFGVGGDQDLVRPSDSTFQLLNGDTHRFLVEIDYVAGGDDTATVWMDPEMSGPRSTWSTQASSVYTATATGDLSFDSILARSGSANNLNSWTFSNLVLIVPEPSRALYCLAGFVCLLLRRRRC